jgi:hypothetical protein
MVYLEQIIRKGDAMEKTQEKMPPYVSYRTFRNFIDGLNPLPPVIDRSVMPNLGGSVQTQLLAALRYLGLIDTNNKTQDDLRNLVASSDETRKEALTGILKRAYPFLFQVGTDFTLESGTAKQFWEAFQEQGTTGDTTRKCGAFFLDAAKDAVIAISTYIEKPTRGQSDSNKSGRTRQPARKAGKQTASKHPSTRIDRSEKDAFIDAVMSKIPTFDPNWSPEAQDNYMKYVERIFSMVEKVFKDSLMMNENKPEI